ncbi:hypothetical protein HanPSC8_Chr01g0032561 [Helianthus annuus]|nr:hypothetical protein HanPSC8_Chr01g0032561 [Helianthus annuus]
MPKQRVRIVKRTSRKESTGKGCALKVPKKKDDDQAIESNRTHIL